MIKLRRLPNIRVVGKYFSFCFFPLFSAPEPKAHVHYCDHALSVVRPSLTFHIFDFSSETAERNSTSKISTTSTKFVFFFGLVGKTRWPPRPLIGWEILDFSSEITERNSTKLDRKQDLNVLYQDCVFFSGRSEKTRRPSWPFIGWDIFDFPLKIAERNFTKLDRKQDLNVLFHVCVFLTDRKNKMVASAFDWLRDFRLFLRNRWTEFNETLQEARSERPLPSLCFSAWLKENRMAAPTFDWLTHFRLSLWYNWTEFNETWQEARSQRPLPSFVFRTDRKRKQDGHPGLWLAETFFDFSYETAEWNSKKLHTKQDLNVLYQVCVFRGGRKNKVATRTLIGWDIFDFSSETAERNSTKLDRKQDLNILYQVCVFQTDRLENMKTARSLIGWDIFDFSSETAERNSTKLDRKQDLNVLYQVCVVFFFRTDRKNRIAAPASDCLRHFRLVLCNRWTEFNETWREARSQRLLPSLWAWVGGGGADQENKMAARSLIDWDILSAPEPKAQVQYCDHALSVVPRPSSVRPSLTFHIFDFFSETTEQNSTKLDSKQDLNVLYQVCIFFFGPIVKINNMASLASDWVRHFRLLLWNHRKEFNETYRKQDLNFLYHVCVFMADRKNKMAALASDLLRHFRLQWNRRKEFNETWQEARSERPLPSLCFSGRLEKQGDSPGLWLAETFFDISSETAEQNSTKLDWKQDLNVLYQVCVFCYWS